MPMNKWKKISDLKKGKQHITTWTRKGLKYPQSEDISVMLSTDGWVVNHSGYNGGESYYSDNIYIEQTEKQAISLAKDFMERH